MVRSASFKIRPTRLVQALGLALAALSGSAQALLVTGSITVSGSASAGALDTYSQTDPTFASDSASASGGGAIANSSSFGRNTGVYYAQANVTSNDFGGAQAQAEVHWQRQVTNDEGVALAILLDAYLYGGQIVVGGGFSFENVASYDWQITASTPGGTITVLDSEASVSNFTGLSDPDGDILPGITCPGGFCHQWAAQQISSFALGILQAGESLTLNYDLVLLAQHNDGDDCLKYGGCDASAETGDPSGTSLPPGASIAITGVQVSAVPEPSSLALVTLAGAAAGALRRRRRADTLPGARGRWRLSP